MPPRPPPGSWRAIFSSRRMAVVFFLGFSSGLPLMLTGQTMQAWLDDAGVKQADIADLSAVGLAYTLKFAWAPIVDSIALPWLGRRRGWLLVFQLGLIAALVAMATLDPLTQTTAFVAIAIAVAILSASQDIVIDAYNTDLLTADERVLGSSLYVLGYRVAMLVASTLALIAADHVVWNVVYAGMAALMLVGVVATVLAEEPARASERTIAQARVARELPAARRFTTWVVAVFGVFIRSFTEMWKRLGGAGMLLMLGFAATYKFGEQFAQVLTMTFFKREIGFTNTDIALANKLVGFAAWGLGGVAGGVLVRRYRLRKMLVAFGVLQALTHVAYLAIAIAGKNLAFFCGAIFIENLAFAMATAAFVSSLMSVCSPAVSATQYALLTSLTSVGQRVFGFLADDVQQRVGWQGFFLTTIAMGIPGIVLAWFAGAISERLNAARDRPQ